MSNEPQTLVLKVLKSLVTFYRRVILIMHSKKKVEMLRIKLTSKTEVDLLETTDRLV